MEDDTPVEFQMSASEGRKRQAVYLMLGESDSDSGYTVALLDKEQMVMAWIRMDAEDLLDFARSLEAAVNDDNRTR